MTWREELRRLVAEGEVLFDEPMRHHTSFRIGGPAEALVVPADRRELRAAVEFAFERDLPWFILGRGTNLLVRDGGVRGLVIKTTRCLRGIAFAGVEVRVEAGLSLSELAHEAAARSLAGLAFAAGIPGTVGGGIYMNAGAYGGELGQVVLSVTAYYPGRGERIWPREELGFGYRTSRFQDERAIIEEARFRLAPGDAAAIRAEMEDYARRRQEKQPLN
ncbi:MAG: FAD-binding protein, partial [Firmicutes bacterium]|nr:FAD-binding protein [Bacillota bacterium]